MEIYRRIAEKISPKRREELRSEKLKQTEFEKGCTELAVSLFKKLRQYDPWSVVYMEFKSPLPLHPMFLDPNIHSYYGQLSAFLDYVTEGSNAPQIAYRRFCVSMYKTEEDRKPVQSITLRNGSKWELLLESETPIYYLRLEEDPAVLDAVQENILKWQCRYTKR